MADLDSMILTVIKGSDHPMGATEVADRIYETFGKRESYDRVFDHLNSLVAYKKGLSTRKLIGPHGGFRRVFEVCE